MISMNVEEACWSTVIDGQKMKLDYVDCFLLCALHDPCVELGALSVVTYESIMEDASKRFGDIPNLDKAIDRASETLENLGLAVVKERFDGDHICLTKSGATIAKRFYAHIQDSILIVRVCERPTNPILSKIEWKIQIN